MKANLVKVYLLAMGGLLAGSSSASATCLEIDWSNRTFGGMWVNNCSHVVTVRWSDDNCDWNCLLQVGANRRQTAGLRGAVNWRECKGYCNP